MGEKRKEPPTGVAREKREARRKYAVAVGLLGVLLTALGMTVDFSLVAVAGIWACMAGVMVFASPRQLPALYLGFGWFMVLGTVFWLFWSSGFVYQFDLGFAGVAVISTLTAAAIGLWLVTCGARSAGAAETYVEAASSGPCSGWLSTTRALDVRYCDGCGRMTWYASAECPYCGRASAS